MFTPEMRMRTHTIFCFKVNSTQVIWKNCDSILKWIFQPTSSTFLKKFMKTVRNTKDLSAQIVFICQVDSQKCTTFLWKSVALVMISDLQCLIPLRFKKNHNLQFLCHKLSGFYCSSCRVFLWSYSFDLSC